LPNKLASTGRFPSYKSIAICILKNDLSLLGIGFVPKQNKSLEDSLRVNNQYKLF
jgi:predicted phosphoadenosine phosphosulfate sulfurtransferase